MKIIYMVRTGLHIYPPCISQLMMLRDLEENVLVAFGECNDNTERLLKEKGISTVNFNIRRNRIPLIGKIQSYIEYKNKAKKLLAEKYNDGDIVWYGTADSCFALGGLVKNYPFILNVLELYDENILYLKGVSRVITKAMLTIACEETRADIMKMWWGLREKPVVMPNKPYVMPAYDVNGSISETQKAIALLSDKKFFVYQGVFSSDRDLELIARAFMKIDHKDVYLALMGHGSTASAERLKGIYPRIIDIGYIPAPYHLEVTRKAFAGIAYYKGCSLNNLFCAPNKIYEYSGCGVPILCNSIPGLRNTVGSFSAGECVDFEDESELCKSINRLIENRDFYTKNATKMFDSVDNKETLKKVLFKVKRLLEDETSI